MLGASYRGANMSVDMKKRFTEIVAIVDRSGSMETIKEDAIGGFNSFLDSQLMQAGRASFTLIQFDDIIDIVHSGESLFNIKPYTKDTYVPRGMTALYDAIGRGVAEASKRSEGRQVLVAILTDGYENSSHEYTKGHIQSLIKQKQAEGWEFLFLAAGFSQFDAEGMAHSIGIRSGNSIGFDRSSIRKVYGQATVASASYRSTGSVGVDWKK